MRVLQLIDSLEAGGAERVAVTYANSLSKHIDSYLCATRAEGLLLETISEEVNYIFLSKKKTIDINAILKLKKFINDNPFFFLHLY